MASWYASRRFSTCSGSLIAFPDHRMIVCRSLPAGPGPASPKSVNRVTPSMEAELPGDTSL
jgi:hypothetical protein